MESTATFFDLSTAIRLAFPTQADKIDSQIRRILLSHLGFSYSNKRASIADLKAAIDFMHCTNLPLLTRSEWVVFIDEALASSDLAKNQQRSPRSYLHKLIGVHPS